MKRLSLLGVLILLVGRVVAQDVYNWEVIFDEEGKVFRHIDLHNNNIAIAVGDDGLVMRTGDGGQHWTDYSDASFGDLHFIDMQNADTAFMTNGYQVFFSKNSGEEWELIRNSKVRINSLFAEMHYSDHLYLACDSGQIWSTGSFGKKWRLIDTKGLIDKNESIKYTYLEYRTIYPDTGAFVISVQNEFRTTIDYFDEWLTWARLFRSDQDLKAVNVYDEYKPLHIGIYNWVLTDDNEYMFLDGESKAVICDYAKEQMNSGLMQNHWEGVDRRYGWAVGDNGYIMEHNEPFYGSMKEVASPTKKDLYWIDKASEFLESRGRYLETEITVMAVGDGVILRKTMGYKHTNSENAVLEMTPPLLSIYPNPSTGSTAVLVSGDSEASIKLYTLKGDLVKDIYRGQLTSDTESFSLNGLDAGMYVLVVQSEQGAVTEKLVVF